MSGGVSRFLGGSPGRVIFQLVVVSLVVGIILSMLGISPYNIVSGFERLVARIYNMGFDTIELVLRYLLLGAIVVVPIWLIMRVMKMGRGN